uniref:Uncharacterized protein n=1 Tax=Manihot esculenta TaxID=3983 RepID=A0A2C9VAK6_MANES
MMFVLNNSETSLLAYLAAVTSNENLSPRTFMSTGKYARNVFRNCT